MPHSPQTLCRFTNHLHSGAYERSLEFLILANLGAYDAYLEQFSKPILAEGAVV